MSEGLKSADWHERQRAVWALGDSKDHAGAVRALEAVLRNDPVRDVRASAATALGQLGGPDVTALLVEKIASTDESIVRVAGLEAIATSRDPGAVPGLINLFRLNRGLRGHDDVVGHDDDVVAQIGARQALLKIGAPGVPQLLQALKDPSPKVRAAVVEVLGKVGNPEVADQISALQADQDFGVRQEVEGALATLKGKPAATTP